MDPIEQFQAERNDAIRSYGSDMELRELSRSWLETTMKRRYVYNFDWLGRPIIQYPQDIVALQEIVWRTRPDLIIETGIAHGGSLILSASLLAMLDYADAAATGEVLDPRIPRRRVIGVDIDIRPHNRAAIEAHPMASRIAMIEGSSIASETIEAVKAAAAGTERIMICLDSMHTQDHVVAELEAYAPLTGTDCYCIVYDSFVEHMPPGFFVDRPWDVGNNPKTAVAQWLSSHKNFTIDADVSDKLLVTVAPGTFLRRTH